MLSIGYCLRTSKNKLSVIIDIVKNIKGKRIEFINKLFDQIKLKERKEEEDDKINDI